MRASYIGPKNELLFDSDKQAERALQTLQLIVSYGGSMDRWRSLIAYSRKIGLCMRSSTWRLSRWYADGTEFTRRTNTIDTREEISDSSKLVRGPVHPQLAHVEVANLPSLLTLSDTSSIFSCLTRLQFDKLLELDIGAVNLANSRQRLEYTTLDRLRISLPRLRDFSLKVGRYQMCGLQLLKIIDAPNVENLELEFPIDRGDAEYLYDDRNWSIPTYLSKGRVHRNLQSLTLPTETLGCGPIFPLVRKLNLGNISSFDMLWQPKVYAELFGVFPDITHLAAGRQCISAMLDEPNARPDLKHITFHIPNYKDIRASLEVIAEYALARQNAGLPISTLRIYTNTPESFFKALEHKAEDPTVVSRILEKERIEVKMLLSFSIHHSHFQELETSVDEEENNLETESSGDEGRIDDEMESGPVTERVEDLDYIAALIGRL
ncbi:hypothetical protein RHS01_09863 [Rhizoctonia solani]|uniref:Uncharacterized protein n=1 Tax=Rhizoctonia solani TaxID=456999 RepID=A0A8H7M312_9AGAM|nr:hypothetical protein RHS01_09863 [Rhizoctonia solani]